jgi:YgiT-type zinc finger domain-containing protein
MISEYDLDCTNCGESLIKREVTSETLGFDAHGSLEVAECPDCGDRYFPETTLERLET